MALPHDLPTYQNWPLLGLVFLPLEKPQENSTIKDACSQFVNIIEEAVNSGDSAHGKFCGHATSFSVQFFGTHDEHPIFQYHHTAASLSQSESGTKAVDANTIYRVGSITKLFTVLTFLVEAGDVHFNEPVTSFVPELRQAAQKIDNALSPIDHVAWEDVTLGALASHMAGIGRDLSVKGRELALQDLNAREHGLPLSNPTRKPPAATSPSCGREVFFEWFTKRHPVFAPSTTPTYSNVAFQILSYALEAITGKTFPAMLKTNIIKALDLNDTTFTRPLNDSNCIIPGDTSTTMWDFDLGELSPAGNIYSSPTDLSKLGRAILKSTLISKAQTRRWLKPVSHTADITFSVGAPWEIHRLKIPASNRVVDLYTKSGGIGAYTSQLILIPDFDVGFSVLAAGGGSGFDMHPISILADFIAGIFLPALENAVREQAESKLAGHYATIDEEGLGSSITLSTDAAKPGLGIEMWISKDVNMLPVLAKLLTSSPLTPITARLYPTNNMELSIGDSGHQKVGYRALIDFPKDFVDHGAFALESGKWFDVDKLLYQGMAFDEFVLEFDVDGYGVGIEPRVSGVWLGKQR